MDEIKSILSDNLIGTLATINEDGSPWASPLHIFSDDSALYWFSKESQQHSENIARDARVSVALWSQKGATRGAYISGNAEALTADETPAVLDIVVSTVGTIPPVFENTSVYRLPIGHINTSKSSENRWYFYT